MSRFNKSYNKVTILEIIFKFRYCIVVILFSLYSACLFATSQYDYYDDRTYAELSRQHKYDISLFIFLFLLIIILLFLGKIALNIIYFFNPSADPKYQYEERQKRAKAIEKQKENEKKAEIAKMRAEAIPTPIDLGLSVKWASFNLGAYKDSDVGKRFVWCEKAELSTARHSKSTNEVGDINGDPDFDIATITLGTDWRMPTDKECDELLEKCKWENVVKDDVKGCMVTGLSGNAIFLPFNVKLAGSVYGKYWTSCPSYTYNWPHSSKTIKFGKEFCIDERTDCTDHLEIRPVYDPKHESAKIKDEKIRNAFSKLTQISSKNKEWLYKKYEKEAKVRKEENPDRIVSTRTGRIVLDPNMTKQDEKSVRYSLDGKRLIDGKQCLGWEYEIKDGTEIICENAFNSHFGKITLPKSLLFIGENALPRECEIVSLSPYYVVLGDFVVDTRKMSIVLCNNTFARKVFIYDPIIEIGNHAFAHKYTLLEITLPNSIQKIGDNSFLYCKNLELINNFDNVKEIGDYAFCRCECLNVSALPKKLVSLGSFAFSGCLLPEKIFIPKNVEKIKDGAFGDGSGITCFEVDKDNKFFCSENGVLFNKDKTKLIAFPSYSSIVNYTIPPSVKEVKGYAFYKCYNLSKVIISSNVTKIEEGAFKNSGLTEITIPSSIRSIEKSTFENCFYLVNVIISNEVTTIGNRAFYGCRNIVTITISNGVRNIGESAFSGCKGLTSITIPNGVTTIGSYVFDGCDGLKEIDIDSLDITLSRNWISRASNLKTIRVRKEIREKIKETVPKGIKIKNYPCRLWGLI